jgi:hypothetical protein
VLFSVWQVLGDFILISRKMEFGTALSIYGKWNVKWPQEFLFSSGGTINKSYSEGLCGNPPPRK